MLNLFQQKKPLQTAYETNATGLEGRSRDNRPQAD